MASRKSTGLFKSLEKIFGPVPGLEEFRPLERIILLLLAHGADAQKARMIVKTLQAEYVDWNEVRVTSPYEIGNWLVKLGPQAARRAEQIKELLVAVYNRFNKLSLECLLMEELASDERRKRERFESWILDRAKAIVQEDAELSKPERASSKTNKRGPKRATPSKAADATAETGSPVDAAGAGRAAAKGRKPKAVVVAKKKAAKAPKVVKTAKARGATKTKRPSTKSGTSSKSTDRKKTKGR